MSAAECFGFALAICAISGLAIIAFGICTEHAYGCRCDKCWNA